MNILFYCKDFYPMQNGYANAYLNLLSSISTNCDYKITIITTTALSVSNELKIDNLNIIRYKNKYKLKFVKFFLNAYSLANHINRIVESERYDLVFVESGDEPMLVSFFNKKVLAKTVVRYHSTSDTEYTQFFPGLLNKINKLLQHRVLSKKINNYCSTNNYHIDFIKKRFLNDDEYLISQKRFFNLPNTLGKSESSIFNSEVNGRKKEIFILGRLNPEGYYQKGFSDVIDVLKNISVQQLNGYQIFILGDGVFYDKVKKSIDNLDIKDNVALVRRLPHEQVIQKLRECTAVILPSRFEGHSMFALEAIACGAIPIFSDAGALKEMTPCPELQFKSQDSFQLRERIIECVNMDKEELEVKSKNCGQWYLNNYKSEIIKDRFNYLVKVLEK